MEREEWGFVVSVVVMLVMCSSYFFKKKSLYLLTQGVGIAFLMAAYILWKEYFAMIGLVIGLARSVVYLLYEWKNKETSIWWAGLFTALGVAGYLIINVWIQNSAKLQDLIYLAGLAAYAFIFRIRNLHLVRYLVLIPTGLSIAYNASLGMETIFVVVSYSFEMCANIVAIIKFRMQGKKEKANEQD